MFASGDIDYVIIATPHRFHPLIAPGHEWLNELTGTHSFKLSGDAECYIGGVKAGKWQVTSGGKTETVTVQNGEGLLTFTASAGTVEVSYVG